MVQPLWRTVWRFLKKLKIELPYDPTNGREKLEAGTDFIFGGPKSLQMVTAAMKLKDAYSLEGKL